MDELYLKENKDNNFSLLSLISSATISGLLFSTMTYFGTNYLVRSELEPKIAKIKQELDIKKSSFFILKKENQILEDKNTNLLYFNSNYKKELSLQKSSFFNLKEENKNINKILSEYDKFKFDVNNSIDTLNKGINDKDILLKRYEAENNLCSNKLESYSSINKELESNLSSISKQNNIVSSKISDLEIKLDKCNSSLPLIVGLGSNIWDTLKVGNEICSQRAFYDDKLEKGYSSLDGSKLNLDLKNLLTTNPNFYQIQPLETKKQLDINPNIVQPGTKLIIPCKLIE